MYRGNDFSSWDNSMLILGAFSLGGYQDEYEN